MQYTTTSQEIFETFYISKTHKKHLKIDENNKIIYFTYPEKKVEINYEPVNILYEDAFLIAAFTISCQAWSEERSIWKV